MFRARPKLFRPTEVSAKVQTDRPITHHDPGNSPRSATPQRHATTAHDQSARAGSNASRPRNSSRTTHERSVRAGELCPRPAEISSANFQSVRPTSSGHDRSDSPKTRLSRPTVRTPRSTRSRF
ncbi:unnamed protein product [Microthlaspi erraticum]|uniref:Uncharacterized protein n=1 Tax=Microthlaspi erraticum TaxID=1685480 RepID=A0A6D2JS77_9BRAS|nr:unnamed protein product [Microthlaspi erraticum]